MDYLTAVKQIQTKKPKDNFMLIEMYYDNKIILPYKDGLAFLAALNNAEKLTEEYNKPHRIIPINREAVRTSILSNEEYENYKIAALLNISLDEVKEAALAA